MRNYLRLDDFLDAISGDIYAEAPVEPHLRITREMIERLRKQQMKYSQVERPAKDGDKVTIDFLGKIGGAEFAIDFRQGGCNNTRRIQMDAVRRAARATRRRRDRSRPDQYRSCRSLP